MNETLKALSDPVRRKILDLLKDKPLNAGEIGEHFELKGATVSHHLSVLKSAGLVDIKHYGTFRIYSINTTLLEEVMCWVMELQAGTAPAKGDDYEKSIYNMRNNMRVTAYRGGSAVSVPARAGAAPLERGGRD